MIDWKQTKAFSTQHGNLFLTDKSIKNSIIEKLNRFGKENNLKLTIKENNVTNNLIGLTLFNSACNSISQNILINNKQGIMDAGIFLIGQIPVFFKNIGFPDFQGNTLG